MGQPEFSTNLTSFNQAQLDAIQAATVAILGAVDAIKNTDIAALNTKVGSAGESPGVNSVFARLGQIAGFTDTLETLVGENTAPAGTSTLFARLAQVADRVQGVRVTKPGAVDSNFGGVIGQWYTLLDVTGAGALYRCRGFSYDAHYYIEWRITVDNGTPIIVTTKEARGSRQLLTSDYFSNVLFSSSLKVEARNTAPAQYAFMGAVDYGLV